MSRDPEARSVWLAGPEAQLLAVASFTAGIALSLVVSSRQLFPGEVSVTRWLLAHVEPWMSPFADALDEAFTDWTATAVYGGLLVLVLLWWGRWAAATFLVAGAFTVLARLGNLVQRPRPTGRLEWGSEVAGSGGYPSGHVVYFVLIFGMLAFFVWELRSPLPRRTTVWFLIGCIVAVGPARVVELDHWPVDVVGAYLLAFPGLVVAAVVYQLGPPRWLAGGQGSR